LEEHWTLYTLGSRGSWPVCGRQFEEFGGGTSCFVLKRGDHAVVIDCGTGLYQGAPLLRTCRTVDVLLTHVHYDHIMGLLSGSVFPPGGKVRFYGQFSRWCGMETLARFFERPFWPVTPELGELVEVGSPGEVELEDGLRVRFHPAAHPDNASLIRLDSEEGSICAAFDYEHAAPFPDEMARGCRILLYDGMYTLEDYPAHKGWGHSCWERGCELAERLDLPQLVITHHNPDSTDDLLRDLEKKARGLFPFTRFARVGDEFHLCREEERK